VFDPEVITVIDLVLTSLESGIPVSGNCLLDQTPAFFKFNRIIRDERKICSDELEVLRKQDQKKTDAANRRRTPVRSGGRRR
jgi:hypothetical protein